MLAAYAGSDGSLDAYRAAWRAWRDKEAELEDLRQAETAGTQELDLLRHQVTEIDAAQLKPEEEDEIADRYRRASNASRLVELSSAAAAALGEDEAGVLKRLLEVQRLVRDLEKLDPSIRERTQGLEGAVMELQELERSLADYAEDLDIDPAEAARLEDRVNLFETLKRKYGGDLVAVLATDDRERRGQS